MRHQVREESEIAEKMRQAVNDEVRPPLRVIGYDYAEVENSAMVMVKMSDGKDLHYKRFRYVGGKVVDEASIGD